MLKLLDAIRKDASSKLDLERKSRLGQFMTSSSVAEFMASLFTKREQPFIKLLDAGAGFGALTTAFLVRARNWNLENSKLKATAFEIDPHLRSELEKLFSCFSATDSFEAQVMGVDFVEEASHRILFERPEEFDFAILNPPYKKIHNESQHRSLLRTVGIETVNLYSAFVALAIKLLKEHGQLVAILPRSFCNGPYYKSFREQIFEKPPFNIFICSSLETRRLRMMVFFRRM